MRTDCIDEGIPGIEIAIIELIVRKDRSSSWLQIICARNPKIIFKVVLSVNETLPPFK